MLRLLNKLKEKQIEKRLSSSEKGRGTSALWRMRIKGYAQKRLRKKRLIQQGRVNHLAKRLLNLSSFVGAGQKKKPGRPIFGVFRRKGRTKRGWRGLFKGLPSIFPKRRKPVLFRGNRLFAPAKGQGPLKQLHKLKLERIRKRRRRWKRGQRKRVSKWRYGFTIKRLSSKLLRRLIVVSIPDFTERFGCGYPSHGVINKKKNLLKRYFLFSRQRLL